MTTTEEPMTNDSGWNRADCTTWCGDGNHNHDPACWGGDHAVMLSQEDGFPREAVEPYDVVWLRKQDPPLLGVYPYRSQPGHREVLYLHVYRPSDNEHLYLDASVHLTADEAVQLAQHLLATAEMIRDS
jgi:hypothetical protein